MDDNPTFKMPPSPARVAVFYKGGTMGMEPDSTGTLWPSKGYLSAQLANMTELTDPGMLELTVFEDEEVVDSSDMGPSDWTAIAADVAKNYYNFDGFVVLMGTDTMAYTASALSFLLENLGKPVILTGSMIPMYMGHSDARRNLILAIRLAAYSFIPEVAVYFHDKLLRGCRCKKTSSDLVDAFDSPNYRPLAVAGVHVRVHHEALLRPPLRPLRVHSNWETSILVLRMIPGFSDDALGRLVDITKPNIRGLILELYGAGNAPSKKTQLTDFVRAASAAGVVVAVVSQCMRGFVDLEQYGVGKQLLNAGAISSHDMTVEAAATKLAFLFGRGLDVAQVKRAITTNLRGELSTDASMSSHPGYAATDSRL